MCHLKRQLPACLPSHKSSTADSEKTFTTPFEKDNEGQQKGGKKRTVTLLVILSIVALILLAKYLFTPIKNILPESGLGNNSQNNQSNVTAATNKSEANVNIQRLLRSLQSPILNVHFVGNDAIVYEDIHEGLKLLSLNKMKSEPLLHFPSFTPIEEPSHDLRYFAFLERTSNHISTKFNATYKILILDRYKYNTLDREYHGSSSKESIKGLMYKVGTAKTDDEAQRFFKWNPVGNDYIFWQDGHLYYSENPESATSVRISSGGPNWEHGIFDWMYEEEIFGRGSKAVWWSKKGKKLAFLSREKTKEKSVMMIGYTEGEQYPSVVELPYPKTHEERLPTYIINVWDKNTGKVNQMDVELRNNTAFHYLYGVKWVVMQGEELLVAIWANRLQTEVSVTICDYTSGICNLVFEYKYPGRTWAEPSDFSSILNSDDAIYMLFPQARADGNSYQHIAKLTVMRDPAKRKDVKWTKSSFLSLGNFDVVQLEAYDKNEDMIYFTALAPSPNNRHLYSTKGSPTTADSWTCVSCKFSNCTYQFNHLSSNFKRILTFCKGPAHPHCYLGELVGGKAVNLVEILKDEDYEKRLAYIRLPSVISDTVPLAEGYEAHVKISLPPDQSIRSGSRSLPVMLKVYAGPGSQIADDRFTMGFEEFLIISRNFAVVNIDGRGSNGRGWKYRSPIYGALGTVEIEDQIEGIRQVIKKYPFLDDRRVSVFGWSYGGYAAALISERANTSFFKCAISVAPVANFLYYDAAYSERYMGSADKSAYNAGDITNDVSNFEKTRLLLIHGMYDDNVHFQNSALFIIKLLRNGIKHFDVMVYPNQDHAIRRRKHLYRTMTSFLDRRCL
ncbi:hypothetical protein RB195_006733 [Necator americanus]|uniref:Peptidase, S9A/B/C family, catalytic domain protein n=1 Tax=Necator americanus TaxID=51031 RepID=A0ABR1BXA9_NECAM